MLGRLRMDVDECISQYQDLSVRIFTPRRYLRLYSGERLKECIIQVVQKHCKCKPECAGSLERFRQYDFAEEGDHIGNPNFTCKTLVFSNSDYCADKQYSSRYSILVSQRHSNNADETYLFRSYNHKPRKADNLLEPNPGTLERSDVTIWEACRATSAAPFYFPKIYVEDRWHMDGAVGENNPSPLAWNEADQMTSVPGSNRPGAIAMLVSIGTGAPRKESRFGGPLKLARWIRRNITDTRKPHTYVSSIAQTSGSPYYRFDVGHGESHRMEHNGISTVKLSDCKPKTLDTLQECTQAYLGWKGADEDVPQLIEDCANILLDHARRRRTEDSQRWKRFISHPSPDHPQYINPNNP